MSHFEEGALALEQFTYVKRGYDPEEVDRYISTLEQVIKSYKEKDNAIKNAIISAQVAADNMVKNAKAQADEYKGQIAKELDKVSLEVDRQRMKIKAFQDVYSGLVRKYLIELDDSEVSDLSSRLDDVDKFIDRLKEIDIVPAPTPTPVSDSGGNYSSSAPVRESEPPSSPAPAPSINMGASMGSMHQSHRPTSPPQKTPPPVTHAPPPRQPMSPLSLGPNSSPSLNKNPMPSGAPKAYSPPQVVARINDDGNYVPSS